MDYQLGHRIKADARDKKFPLGALLGGKTNLVAKFWEPGAVMDQGQTSSCVGHACSLLVSSAPRMQTKPDPFTIYKKARQIDEFADDQPGTSVRAGMQTLKNLGLVKSFHWAGSIDDIKQYLCNVGPIVFGTPWYDSMMFPKRNGKLVINGSHGSMGHAYLGIGWDEDFGIMIQNSYGEIWSSIGGRAFISDVDMERLLDEGGVACAGIE